MTIMRNILRVQGRGPRVEGRAVGRAVGRASSRLRCRSGVIAAKARAAFTLIEMMVVVALISVIILGLMAMFDQTQRAFKLGMSQTDVLESGRLAIDLTAREFEGITPSYFSRTNFTLTGGVTNYAPNFYEQVRNCTLQSLPGTTAFRTNIMSDVFFLVRQNQTWTGIGYFVRSNRVDNPNLPGTIAPIGALYRFETNDTVAEFERNPTGLFTGFYNVIQQYDSNNVSKIVDGVVHFRVRMFDTSGWMIPVNPFYYPTNQLALTNFPAYVSTNLWFDQTPQSSGEIGFFEFFSNAVPAAVEMELGVLEPQIYDQYKSIPIDSMQRSFLTNQAAHVHLFRQRSQVRTVDPAAYQ